MGRKQKKDWLAPPDWWKKYRPIRLLALGLLGYGVWSWIDIGHEVVKANREPHPDTAAFTAVLANPVDLIAPLRSFQSLEDVQDVLRRGDYIWRGVRIPTPGTHRNPPRNLQTVVVNGYLHLEVPGQLTLEFFNDRLYEASFVPDQPADYAPRLAGIADGSAVVGEGAAACRTIIAEAIRPTQPKSQQGSCGLLPSSVWLPAAHGMQDAWPVPG